MANSYLGYNINPGTQTGSGAYGAVPGAIGVPPSIYQEIGSVAPGLDNLTAGTGSVIGSQLAGQISPSTMNNIGNYAAARGVASGQPNSPLSNAIGLGLVGQTSEQLQQQGTANYGNFLGSVGQTQINPQLTTDIAFQNAVNAAAPNPGQAAGAASAQQNAWMNYLYQMMQNQNPAGGYGEYAGFSPQWQAALEAGGGMATRLASGQLVPGHAISPSSGV
jgi:hypothetical protein